MPRYPLSLPPDLRREAAQWADRQGVSLNQFILWSVAEKVGELRGGLDDPRFPGITYRRGASGQPTAVLRGTGIRVQTIVIAERSWGLSAAEIAADYEIAEGRVRECLEFYAAQIDAAIQAEEAVASAGG
jgi:uncharacterized protein (DUF433 family)